MRLQPVLDYAVWAEEANANETIRMLPARRPSPVPGSVTVGHLLPHPELWNGGADPTATTAAVAAVPAGPRPWLSTQLSASPSEICRGA